MSLENETSLVTFSVLDEEIRMLSKVNINKVYLELTIQNSFAIKAVTLCKTKLFIQDCYHICVHKSRKLAFL